MELRGVNDRIKKLREQSEETTPHIFMECTMLMTGAYKKYGGEVSVPELHALSMKKTFSRKTITVEDGEPIIGDKGAGPQSTSILPELCCHTLGNMKVVGDRKLTRFKVNNEDVEQQGETIVPFQKERSIRRKIVSSMSQEWKDYYEAGIFTKFMKQHGPEHTVSSERIYTKGFLDYQQDIEEAITVIDFLNDPGAIGKRGELHGVSIMCDVIIALGKRYTALTRESTEKESDPVRKEELLQITTNYDIVPAHKPKTYWQAIQVYWFVHLGVTTELDPWNTYSPGRLDQHLNLFYETDIEAGRLDRSKARRLLECLWVKFNNQPAPPRVGITLKEPSTYTDFANINTGRITPDREDGINDVSYLILGVMDEMKLLQPSSGVQISKKTPMKFIKRTCEISRKGWGQPTFYNTEAIVQELLNVGKSIEDTRRGGASDCVETGAFGREAYILQGYFNPSKILEVTLHSGWDPVGGKQLGLQLGEAEDSKNYDKLFDAYKKQIGHFADIKIKGSNMITRIYAKYMPAPFPSIITDNCVTNGKDHDAGGARYNTNYLQGVGIRTITDSLSVIRYDVYNKKNFTMGELMKALQGNFEEEGHVRLYGLASRKTPKCGSDDDYADAIMKEMFTSYKNAIAGRPSMCSDQQRINMLPTTCHVYFSEVMLASPNGHLAHKPVGGRISPGKAADVNRPTPVIHSASRMDHLSTGGTLLDQKFIPSVAAGEDGLSNMADLIRSHFNMDGHHIRFNVIDRETLIKAQQNPAEYRDLIVRVTGYSDHFRNLSKKLQGEITNRTEQSLS